jgi:RsiW-degrading membrane proteinase PrsW (M82 family)
MEYIALAIAPGIAICLFIFYRDVYNREPKFNLIISFILGCASILPAIFFENSLMRSAIDGTVGGVAIASYLVIAFSEEGGKFLGLRLYSYNQKSFDEPLDGIVYAVMISMGFATVENIKYVYFDAAPGTEYTIGLLRMFTAVPAHATFAIVMGYFVGRAKFEPKNSFVLMFAGLAGAIFWHGTYDFFLLLPQYSLVGQEKGNEYLAIGGFVSFIICIVLCSKLIKRHRKISQQMFKPKNPPPPPSA